MGCYVPVMQMVSAWWTLSMVISLGLLGYLIEAYKFCCNATHLTAKSGFSLLDKVQIVRYLVMGWACLFVIWPVFQVVPIGTSICYAAGGITFTIGVPIFMQHKMEYHMPIWHFAVLAASFLFFAGNAQTIGIPLPK